MTDALLFSSADVKLQKQNQPKMAYLEDKNTETSDEDCIPTPLPAAVRKPKKTSMKPKVASDWLENKPSS